MNETCNITDPLQLEIRCDTNILQVPLSSLTLHDLLKILSLLFMDVVAYLLHAFPQTSLAVFLSEF